jgi:hypothetical protein
MEPRSTTEDTEKCSKSWFAFIPRCPLCPPWFDEFALSGNFQLAIDVLFFQEVAMHVFGLFLFPFFGCGFVLYFLPTIVALLRERHDRLSIFLLNFLLGWSLIGWIVALIWACKNDRIVYVQSPQRY